MPSQFHADIDSYHQASKSHAQAADSVQTWIDGMPANLADEVARTHGKIAAPFAQALGDVLNQRATTGSAVRDGHTQLSSKLLADAAMFTSTDSDNAAVINPGQ